SLLTPPAPAAHPLSLHDALPISMPLVEAAPGVPDAVSTTVMRALAHDPADRYESAEDFGVALADAAGGVWGPGWVQRGGVDVMRSEEHTSELQSLRHLVCRLLLE